MSGGHYDCFYEWDDLSALLSNLDLMVQVADDYSELGMTKPAKIIRAVVGVLQPLREIWDDCPAPKLCHHMDWYQSLDSSEESMRERVTETLKELDQWLDQQPIGSRGKK